MSWWPHLYYYSYSNWVDVIHRIPQGSILDLLLFNVLVNDIFFVGNSENCNFTDGNTLCSYGSNLPLIIWVTLNMMNMIWRIFYIGSKSIHLRQIQENFSSWFLGKIITLNITWKLNLLIITLSWRSSLSYRNQSIDLQSKSMG